MSLLTLLNKLAQLTLAGTMTTAMLSAPVRAEKPGTPAPTTPMKFLDGSVLMTMPGELTLTTENRQQVIKVPENTAITKDGQSARLADLRARDYVRVMYTDNGKNITATRITARSVK